ncbi:MAG: N-6 DNA methylase [Hallerella porci]|nr:MULTISPECIES: TaqI-like C-terminal specificity domain-containing protein [Hallerella]MCI5601457.1 N-6 DNA methylase [Hallerella sp.]MDY3922507.1 N-6 DNA methylase [Hallerella porci]
MMDDFNTSENSNEVESATFFHAGSFKISNATARNWKRLNTHLESRLTTRANKRKSSKRILPVEYISHSENISFLQSLLDLIDENHWDIFAVIYTMAETLLKDANLFSQEHIQKVLHDYNEIKPITALNKIQIPKNEFDILGLVYQSYLQEGKKNIIGSYYTPKSIVENMIREFDFSKNQTFLDPCCGSGAFLLNINVQNPNLIFGCDQDKIAVLIAKINLLLKYKNFEFIPQIYHLDFLQGNSLFSQQEIFGKKFDYIATNPPWGAMDNSYCEEFEITSKETFSCFFVKAFSQLKKDGIIRFLFPEAILNVKVHQDIRKFILNHTCLSSITIYGNSFSGVVTKYVDIECKNTPAQETIEVFQNNEKRIVKVKTFTTTENYVFNLLSNFDAEIVCVAKEKGHYFLNDSIWALGIVTGGNHDKLKDEWFQGSEKIYTGKEIQAYLLKPAKKYIIYNRGELQQVAKDEIYRAKEKIVYKFISKKLVFAYDNSQSLFLNSANILIPNVPHMSIKTVMAFLNSSLFQFLYLKLFGGIKILKGNLMQLPFPEISEKDDKTLAKFVDEILNGNDSKISEIDNFIFAFYKLNQEQINYIKETVYGNFN